MKDQGGKRKRLKFLREQLQLDENKVDNIRYQLLHRTVSAVIKAKEFNASNALMLIHSFSQYDEWFDDYREFFNLFNSSFIEPNTIKLAKKINNIDLYLGWVRGNEKYLKV